MAIRQGGVTVIDDSRNIVNADSVMLNGDFTPYSGEGPNILWSSAGSLVSTFDNPNAYGTSADDYFGWSVAISGNYAIVGAYQEDDQYGTSSGKAYIYNNVTGSLIRTLNNPNPYITSTNDFFGWSVAISGNYAIVGAYAEDSATSAGASGRAYIFNVTTGALVLSLDNPNAYTGNSDDWFGYSVSISGNYAIVGATGEADAGGTQSGKAYIYNVATGALIYTLNNPNAYSTSAGDQFGWSVAVDGNYAIVGAYVEDDSFGNSSGKAYIYNVTTGALVWTLDNPNAYPWAGSATDQFGVSVALSGNYAIVGARSESDVGGSNSGKAYIYNVTTGALVWTLNNPNAYSTSASDFFGWSVAISGNYAIVGAPQEDDAGGTQSGKAYIFNVTTGALVWTLNNPNAYSLVNSDWFGNSVAISGNYAIVGAYLEDDAGGSASGKAYTFALNTTYRTGKPLTTASDFGYVRKNAAGSLVWTLDNPNAYSTSLNDFFGASVAISGNFAIVGAYQEDDVGGTDSGKAYIFNVTTGALVHTLNNPNAYSTSADDRFAISVAISNKYAVVGASGEDDTATALLGTGVIYVYDILSGSLLYSIRNPRLVTGSYGSYMYFGYSVTISDDYILATAYGSDGSSGTAYIYSASSGQLLWSLTNPSAYGTGFGDYFGISSSISNGYIIIGASREGDPTGVASGKAYIFNAATGALVWTLDNPNVYSTGSFDLFGSSVAISGNYAIVGAYDEDNIDGLSSGAAYIFNVTTGALVWTLNNPTAYSTAVNDIFGWSVAISGNYAIVSSRQEDEFANLSSGKAYIFNVTTGALVHTLNNPNAYSTSDSDLFGHSVAISGNYAIVGAYNEDDAKGTDSGKAYIFSINDTYKLTNVEEVQLANGMKISADNKLLQQSVPGGALIHTLDNPNAYSTSASDEFGFSLSISGNYAIVGAYLEDDAGGTWSGKAYIFNVTTGALVHTLNNPNAFNTSDGDRFAHSVSISGNYAIVGAIYEDDAGGGNSGKAYIFNVTTGALVHTLNNPNAYSLVDSDWFGNSVAISGNYAVVSAINEDDAVTFSAGKAYIFNVTNGVLLWTLNNPLSSIGFNFGNSVAISGNYAIIGASLISGDGIYSGRAFIYSTITGALLWTLNNPNAYSTSADDRFGSSVAISGNYAIVGAYGEDDTGGLSSGKAYIFNVTTGALVHTLNNPNAYSTSDADLFGTSVAISGNYAIVGAYQESDSGGLASGKAYIFDATAGQLIYTLNNPNAYSTSSSDQFGTSVSISENYTIVSAHRESDPLGGASGKAYIFSVRDLTYLDRLVQMVS